MYQDIIEEYKSYLAIVKHCKKIGRPYKFSNQIKGRSKEYSVQITYRPDVFSLITKMSHVLFDGKGRSKILADVLKASKYQRHQLPKGELANWKSTTTRFDRETFKILQAKKIIQPHGAYTFAYVVNHDLLEFFKECPESFFNA